MFGLDNEFSVFKIAKQLKGAPWDNNFFKKCIEKNETQSVSWNAVFKQDEWTSSMY